TAPATYVINKNNFEVGSAQSYVVEKIFEGFASVQVQAASSRILVTAHDRETAMRGINSNGFGLVLNGIPLHASGHADVLRRLDFILCLAQPQGPFSRFRERS